MSNRTLFILTALLIAGMITLFSMNLTNILTGQPPNQNYLKYYDVQGIAVGRNGLLYTLSFKQQNKVIEILNAAVPIIEIESQKRSLPQIDKLVIYLLENKPAIVLTPVAYVDNNLILSAPAWVPNGYLMELSEGDLKNLLAETYD